MIKKKRSRREEKRRSRREEKIEKRREDREEKIEKRRETFVFSDDPGRGSSWHVGFDDDTGFVGAGSLLLALGEGVEALRKRRVVQRLHSDDLWVGGRPFCGPSSGSSLLHNKKRVQEREFKRERVQESSRERERVQEREGERQTDKRAWGVRRFLLEEIQRVCCRRHHCKVENESRIFHFFLFDQQREREEGNKQELDGGEIGDRLRKSSTDGVVFQVDFDGVGELSEGFREGTAERVGRKRNASDVIVGVARHSVPVVIARIALEPVVVGVPRRSVCAVIQIGEGLDCVVESNDGAKVTRAEMERRKGAGGKGQQNVSDLKLFSFVCFFLVTDFLLGRQRVPRRPEGPHRGRGRGRRRSSSFVSAEGGGGLRRVDRGQRRREEAEDATQQQTKSGNE